MTSPYHNRLPMAYLPASRAVESVGIPPMFRSRVIGLGDVVTKEELDRQRQKYAEAQANTAKEVTPIATFYLTNQYTGEPRKISIYGYNKDVGFVWFNEGPNAKSETAIFANELIFENKPEWLAVKKTLVKEVAPTAPKPSAGLMGLPLILGAAYLLLS